MHPHRMLGSDTSLRAVQRARRECAAAGVDAALLVADMRWRHTDIHDLEHFQVHEHADGTRTTERRTTAYRAYTRAALSELATAAGLRDVRWHMPLDTNFLQPVMTAHSPT
jgi:hypothetical protein